MPASGVLPSGMLVDENDHAVAARRAVRPGRGLEIGLWLSVPVTLLVVHVLQIFEQFSTVGCEGACDLDRMFAARAVYPWAVSISLVVAIAAAVVLRLRGKPPVWAAVLATVLVLTSATITSLVFQSGLAAMYERNERVVQGKLRAAAPPSPVGDWGTADAGAPFLTFLPDGSFTGTDGCNDLGGRWSFASDGGIDLQMQVETTTSCDGFDSWLSQGSSGRISEDFLYIGGATGSTIGGLGRADPR